jgi:hypothetical protein
MKFLDNEKRSKIAKADSVKEARALGRSSDIRSDWNDQRILIMTTILRKKFTDPELAQVLQCTGDADLVMEGYDDFWGTGKNHDGQNHLGEVLMQVRSELNLLMGLDPDEEDPPSLYEALTANPDDELVTSVDNMYESIKIILKKYDELQDVFGEQNVDQLVSVFGESSREIIIDYFNALKDCRNSIDDIDGLLSEIEEDANQKSVDVARKTITEMCKCPNCCNNDLENSDDWLNNFFDKK